MVWLRARRKARRWNNAHGWEFAGLAAEGCALDIWPVNFWESSWVALGHQAVVRDPRRGERVSAACYFVEHDQRRIGFASVEVAPGEHLFFLPIL